MLILGNMLWRSTGVGAPPPVPPQPPTDPLGFGYQPSGGIPTSDRARTKEEISRDRLRFGLRDEVAEALEAVAKRQAQAAIDAEKAAEVADEQKRFDELYRELELRSIEFEARYQEALGAMREAYIAQIRQQK